MKDKGYNYLNPNYKSIYYGWTEVRGGWEIPFIILSFIMAASFIACGLLMIFVFEMAAFSPPLFILSIPFLFWAVTVLLNRPNHS